MRTPTTLPLRLAALVAALGLLTCVLAAPATAATHRTPSATSPVTWNGWRGVGLGTTLTSAHRRLGGTLTRVDSGGGCGDVLTTRTGKLDGNIYRRPHRVGNISVKRSVHYPLGIRVNMRPARVVRIVKQSKYALGGISTTNDGGGRVREDWVVGPNGHRLYFAYTGGMIFRMGLAINQHVARGQMEINGC
jgi:hypothetical protein